MVPRLAARHTSALLASRLEANRGRHRTDGAKFGQVTLAGAIRKLADETRLLGAQGAAVSCNSSDRPDPGVAFTSLGTGSR